MSERRWTYKRFEQRVTERLAEGKVRGATPAEEKLTATNMAAADMCDDYEVALATQAAEIERLRAENSGLRDWLSSELRIPDKVINSRLRAVGAYDQ